MKLRLPIGKKLFLSHLLTVMFVSCSFGVYFYLSATESLMNNLQSRLKHSAALISQALDANKMGDIREKNDTLRPVYQRHLDMLRSFRQTNPDIAYLYIMRRIDNRLYFVIDSDETERQALPGQEYLEMVPALYDGFFRPSVDDKIYTDKWGSFLSGYSPIKNGKGEYLVGIDMDAREVKDKFKQLRIAGTLSLVGSIILALFFSRIFSSRIVSTIQVFVSKCRAIAKGSSDQRLDLRTGDELDQLVEAFNNMSADLLKSQEENRQAKAELKKTNDELEVKVNERTQNLLETNGKLTQEIAERKHVEAEREKTMIELQQTMAKVRVLRGLIPICCSCKKIRNDEGYWQQLESYIRDHTEAEFSHGFCPDCVKKLYPQLT